VEEGEEGDAGELCDRLGIDVLPTLQFWRGGQKVWEHKGVVKLDQDLGEGGRMTVGGWQFEWMGGWVWQLGRLSLRWSRQEGPAPLAACRQHQSL
jgi:hypothetical protein